ncbi:MAG: cohesin domain-containing protein, partial [Fervidobacterium sp.]
MYTNRNVFVVYRAIGRFALLLLLLTLIPSSRGSSASIAVDPSFKEVIINSVFEIDLNVSDVTDLYLWVITIEWNPSIIEFQSYTEGPFLKAGGATAIMDAGVSPGKLNMLVCTVLGPVSGVDGSGSLVTFTFKAISLGTTPISITFSDLLNSNGDHISHDTYDGLVLVSLPPPPLSVSISPLSASILVGQSVT